MSPVDRVRNHLVESAAVKRALAESSAEIIARAAEQIAARIASGGKLMLCGNGGSAADSQHIAAEFTSRLGPFERPGIPALALTTDTSFLTARANDYGFDGVFERLVDALAQPDDVLIGISTSGGSRNIVRAVKRAREKGVFTIGLLGGTGGALASLVDQPILVPSTSTQHIQESHIAIGHILCHLVEEFLYGSLADAFVVGTKKKGAFSQ